MASLWLVMSTTVAISQNWICNDSLWTTLDDSAWSFDFNNGCSVTSSDAFEATVLWVGDNLNESLNWRNYRITATVTLIEGEDVGIVVRANNALPFAGQGHKYIFVIFASNIEQYKSTTTTFAINYVKYFEDDYFYKKQINVTLDVFENRFILFLNNEFIFEYYDNCKPIYYSGSIGLRTYSSISTFSYFNIDLNPSYIKSQQYNALSSAQQYALNQIYITTNGPYWITTWNITQIKTEHACSRLCGIICQIYAYNHENITNIVSLSLANNNLSGSISQDIMHLNKLRSLDLQSNNLWGSLPDIFDHFEDFQSLWTHNNPLNGTLPNSLQSIHNLIEFDVSGTNVTGDVNSIFIHDKLSMLFLQNNRFYGTLSNNICNLNKIVELNMAHNSFNGSFPDCISNWKRLKVVQFSSNNITGNLPQSICDLQSLTKLDLAEMKLTGSIPLCIGNLMNLWE
eukprot:431951_1